MRAGTLSVREAARVLGCSVRTARRWLQNGRLAGRKLGRDWVVWDLPLPAPADVPTPAGLTPARVRARLRAVGARLIATGNALAAPAPRPGMVFLAWRAPRSLGVTFAIGRAHPTRGWTPIALGLEYPFWLEGRTRWRPVLLLLRRYERLRLWCASALLRVPGVSAVVLDELTRLETALGDLHPPATPAVAVEASVPAAGDVAAPGVDPFERGPRDTGPRMRGR